MDTTSAADEGLRSADRCLLALLGVALVAFGWLVLVRSAFLQRKMGDLGCFLAAGRAVRTGGNMYEVTDHNGWHYNYPPLFGVLMAPLADRPPGVVGGRWVPYAVTVCVFYAVNVLLLALAVHWLAGAIDPDAPRGTRRWWALRVLPALVCLVPIGHTLNRAQTNILMLTMVCGLIAGLASGRRFAGGLCLAFAACVKVFPAFLVLVPLWRRDGRCLAGFAAGLVVGLALVPAAVLGPARTAEHYRNFARVLIGPALGLGGDQTRAKELIETTATDNQSFQTAFLAALHFDRATRPPQAPLAVRAAALAAGAALTLLTLAADRGPRARSGVGLALFVGCLSLVMLPLSPVCHSHYYVLVVPVAGALLAIARQRQARHGGPLLTAAERALAAAFVAATILPHLPWLRGWRDLGLPTYAALLIWGAGVAALRRLPAAEAAAAPPLRRAA